MNRRWLWLIAALLLIGAVGLVWLSPTSGEPASSMADLGLMLLDEEDGVSVLAVRDRSPADRAGIMPGDLLTIANGIPFHTIEQLEKLLHAALERSMLLQLQRSPQQEPIRVRLFLH